jgi:hypothetical protein
LADLCWRMTSLCCTPDARSRALCLFRQVFKGSDVLKINPGQMFRVDNGRRRINPAGAIA